MSIYRRIKDMEDFQLWLDNLPKDGSCHEMRTAEFIKQGVSVGFIESGWERNSHVSNRVFHGGWNVLIDNLTPLTLFDQFPEIFLAFCETGVYVRKPRKQK